MVFHQRRRECDPISLTRKRRFEEIDDDVFHLSRIDIGQMSFEGLTGLQRGL